MAPASPAPPLLPGIRVLDLGTDVAGAYCALQFAKFGADVDRFSDAPAPTGWAVYLDAYLHAGKNRVRGPSGLPEAVGAYDVVIGEPDAPWAELAPHLRDGAVTATVDPFGETGPYRDWKGTELVFASAGGATGYTRADDGRPVFGFGHRYEMLAGLYLFTAACAALGGADGPGEPRVPALRVSAMETVASVLPYLTTQYVYNGSLSTVEQSGPRYTGACDDGYVVIYAGGPWADMVTLFQRPDLAGDARFETQGERFRNEAELGRMFAEWCGARTVAEVVAAADAANVAICPAVGLAGVLEDEQLALRDGWEPIEVPGAGTGRAPREPYVVNRWRTARTKENA